MQLYAAPGNQYEMLFIAKGGGSANKTMLYQQQQDGAAPVVFYGTVISLGAIVQEADVCKPAGLDHFDLHAPSWVHVHAGYGINALSQPTRPILVQTEA
eukprot:1160499-Pelagomonas_calceolata.AAC.10